MSTDKVNMIPQSGKDITWETLVTDSKEAIKTHKETIGRLNKSIVFFKRQIEDGKPFPKVREEISKRHQETS